LLNEFNQLAAQREEKIAALEENDRR